MLSPAAEKPLYILVKENGLQKIVTATFWDEAAAQAEARASWVSWVLYRRSALFSKSLADVAETQLEEVASGGIGFGHGACREHARLHLIESLHARSSARGPHTSPQSSAISSVVDRSRSLAVAASASFAGDGGALADPLLAAVDRVQSVAGEAGASAPLAAGAAAGSRSHQLRSLFSEALSQQSEEGIKLDTAKADAECASLLVGVAQSATAGEADESADALLNRLVCVLEERPPSDSEMCRLRRLSERCDSGLEGYAVASAWLAALFVRTEACILAQSKLNHTVLALDTQSRLGVMAAARPLVENGLPKLLRRLRDFTSSVRATLSQVCIACIAADAQEESRPATTAYI